MDYTKRIAKVRQLMKKMGFGSLLITKPENVYYLSGISSDSAAIMISDKEQHFLTDPRCFLKTDKLKGTYKAVEVTKGLNRGIIETALMLKIKELAFEESSVVYSDFNAISKAVRLKESGALVEQIRAVKDKDELKCLIKAGKIIKKSVNEIGKLIKPGMTEKEIAGKLNCLILQNGGDGIAFPIIVASGKYSAIPHHITSDKVIKEGDFVLIDAGARYRHYNSDTTRTFVVGKPSVKQKEILKIVKEAQQKAIQKVSVGVKFKTLDKQARSLIEYSGYGENFSHGLGHGIGLEVHESPAVRSSDERARENMVFTIEPGVYIKGFGGVRIEDTIQVTKDGVKVLT